MIPPDLLSAANRLLSEIAAAGGSVGPYRYVLRVFPPRGGLPPAILSRLGQHRPAMARLLGYAPEIAETLTLEVVGPMPRPAFRATVQGQRRVMTLLEPATVCTSLPAPSPTPPAKDPKKDPGAWVRVGGGGWRYRLPRLSEPCFVLLCRLTEPWSEITSDRPDPRTMRALEDRGLAEFKTFPRGKLEGRLTVAGAVVRDARRRKVDARQRRDRRATRARSEGGSPPTVQ